MLVLDGSSQAFGKDVTLGAAASVHADFDIGFLE